MWNKPKEFTNNKYEGNGFEISTGPTGDDPQFFEHENVTIKSAVNAWKKSKPHNDVIINLDIWKDTKWLKIGAAVYGSFANAWFSDGNGITNGAKWTGAWRIGGYEEEVPTTPIEDSSSNPNKEEKISKGWKSRYHHRVSP